MTVAQLKCLICRKTLDKYGLSVSEVWFEGTHFLKAPMFFFLVELYNKINFMKYIDGM